DQQVQIHRSENLAVAPAPKRRVDAVRNSPADAETLASRVPRREEYIARVPAVAILPWFLAVALFPIAALPTGLTWIAKALPLTHGLALMRYGLLGDATGLHQIWSMSDPTAMAALSLGVVAVFAVVLTAVSIRVFTRSVVR